MQSLVYCIVSGSKDTEWSWVRCQVPKSDSALTGNPERRQGVPMQYGINKVEKTLQKIASKTFPMGVEYLVLKHLINTQISYCKTEILFNRVKYILYDNNDSKSETFLQSSELVRHFRVVLTFSDNFCLALTLSDIFRSALTLSDIFA